MLLPSLRRQALGATFFVVLGCALSAQIPSGYYDTVDTTNATTLRTTLHDVIDDHQRFPYTSGATDTWDVLEIAQEDPGNASNIIDIYKNASYPKQGGGNPLYNREHTWPKSYGFPNDNSDNYPYTDCHQLHLCNDSYNSSRSNKPYRTCSASCSENPTDFNNGVGGGTGTYPGNSNWTSGSFTQGTWETWIGKRGDVARSLLYLDVRYEGGNHGITNSPEPDLILTDNETLIDNSNTGNNESVAYMGMLTVLLQWHTEDPVDQFEIDRNDAIYNFQGNRNPFVDHPEWVDCLFNGVCGGGGDVTPPADPTGLSALGGPGSVSLDWDDNGEGDLAGYDVLRATSTGGPYSQLNGSLVANSNYVDSSVVAGQTYFYVVLAEDTSGNESGFSAEASAIPTTPPVTMAPWINELHYDNSGSDTGEFVEVAAPAGFDLSGWTVELYNGNGGSLYDTIPLAGIVPDGGACVGALSFFEAGIQNGAPDGLALVDPLGNVVEFLSYEGSFTATGGNALGMGSTDIGVSESSATQVGESLQLGGTGKGSAAFTWQAAQNATGGSVNAGQSFVTPGTSTFGSGTAGSLGLPGICTWNSAVAGANLQVVVANVPAVTPVWVGVSAATSPPLDLSNGLLLNLSLPLLVVTPLVSNPDGHAVWNVVLPPGTAGLSLMFQSFALDGTGGDLFSSSLGLQVDVP